MLENVVATDFHCQVGSNEFSFGRCDREAFQDLLQFLCGMREGDLSGSFVAKWKGRLAQYELRRVVDGTSDGGIEWGLLDARGQGTCGAVRRDASSGLQCGLGDVPVGCASEQSGRFECSGADVDHGAFVGSQSVAQGETCGPLLRTGESGGVRVERSAWGAGTVRAERGVNLNVRGPNYERNQANRLRRKEAKLQVNERKSFFDGCDEEVVTGLRNSRAELLLLENRRRIIEEKRKIKKLESPMQAVEDAMSAVRMANSCSKLASVSRVADWAVGLANASAESLVTGSSGSPVGSADTAGKSSVSSLRVKKVSSSEKSVSVDSKIRIKNGVFLDEQNRPYSAQTAASWMLGYVELGKSLAEGMGFAKIVSMGVYSRGEVTKYLALSRKFSISYENGVPVLADTETAKEGFSV